MDQKYAKVAVFIVAKLVDEIKSQESKHLGNI